MASAKEQVSPSKAYIRDHFQNEGLTTHRRRKARRSGGVFSRGSRDVFRIMKLRHKKGDSCSPTYNQPNANLSAGWTSYIVPRPPSCRDVCMLAHSIVMVNAEIHPPAKARTSWKVSFNSFPSSSDAAGLSQ